MWRERRNFDNKNCVLLSSGIQYRKYFLEPSPPDSSTEFGRGNRVRIWPINFFIRNRLRNYDEIGSITLSWSTVSLLTLKPGQIPIYENFFIEIGFGIFGRNVGKSTSKSGQFSFKHVRNEAIQTITLQLILDWQFPTCFLHPTCIWLPTPSGCGSFDSKSNLKRSWFLIEDKKLFHENSSSNSVTEIINLSQSDFDLKSTPKFFHSWKTTQNWCAILVQYRSEFSL